MGGEHVAAEKFFLNIFDVALGYREIYEKLILKHLLLLFTIFFKH